MKNLFRRILCTALTFGSLPFLAGAHPGHSALDFTAGLPHPGHESELATLFMAAGLTMFVFGISWIVTRRR